MAAFIINAASPDSSAVKITGAEISDTEFLEVTLMCIHTCRQPTTYKATINLTFSFRYNGQFMDVFVYFVYGCVDLCYCNVISRIGGPIVGLTNTVQEEWKLSSLSFFS